MSARPRVALFTDSYLEVNGVANTSRQLTAYAARHGHPFLVVHAGPRTEEIIEGSLTRLMLYRSGFGFRLDSDLRFDLLLLRHLSVVNESIRRYRPDLIHVTGPSDIGLLGALVAWQRGIPVVLSWHTNVHHYARARLAQLLRRLKINLPARLGDLVERASLKGLVRFYAMGRVLLAPNEELAEMLESECRRPVFLMKRGIDATLFAPEKRERIDSRLNLGFVGRLTIEKNVRFLARLERELLESGCREIKFTIVGTGNEETWLREQMKTAVFTGVLSGEALARAYANMDLFIFPSTTDTFGNVVLEALASGVPALVSAGGGPKFIVRNGESGFILRRESDYAPLIRDLHQHPELRQQLSAEARRQSLNLTWEMIFDGLFNTYQFAVDNRTVGSESVEWSRSGEGDEF